MKTLLVTGGAGHIGDSELVAGLLTNEKCRLN